MRSQNPSTKFLKGVIEDAFAGERKNKKKEGGLNFKEAILDMAANCAEFSRKSVGFKRYWYWDYYKSIEQDVKDAKEKRRIYQQIYHMERFGYFTSDGFSKKGLEKVSRLMSREKEVLKMPSKWDKKWRIVIFDIPEKMKKTRNAFRESLKRMGFRLLQNSIWMCPYGNFDEIQDLAKELHIEKYVVLIGADRISNDVLCKKIFSLS